MSAQNEHEFVALDWVSVESIGSPGSRYFRILLQSGIWSACLWLEKEQLHSLGIGILKFLSKTEFPDPFIIRRDSKQSEQSSFSVEFKIGHVTLTQNPNDELLNLSISRADQEETEIPSIQHRISLKQLEGLAQEAFHVLNAGRPRCPLCHAPIGTAGHQCLRTNGHGPEPPE